MAGTVQLFDENRNVLKALIAGGAVYQALSQGEPPKERDRSAFLAFLEGPAAEYHMSRETGAKPAAPGAWRFPVVTDWIRGEHAAARALVPALARSLEAGSEHHAAALPALKQYLEQVRWMIHVENDWLLAAGALRPAASSACDRSGGRLAHARPAKPAARRPRRVGARLRQLEAA